jgi:hypothetical protein
LWNDSIASFDWVVTGISFVFFIIPPQPVISNTDIHPANDNLIYDLFIVCFVVGFIIVFYDVCLKVGEEMADFTRNVTCLAILYANIIQKRSK